MWQLAMGYVTPTFFCQEATVGLQVSVVFGAHSESQRDTDSQQRYSWRDWEKEAVLLVRKFRTVGNNLIAFQVDYVFTRNLFP